MRCLVRPDEDFDIVERETSVSLVAPSVGGLTAGLRTCPRSDIVPSQVQLTKHHRANQPVMWESMLLIRKAVCRNAGLALSGSDQARKGRLVDALAARGDEGRDTLR